MRTILILIAIGIGGIRLTAGEAVQIAAPTPARSAAGVNLWRTSIAALAVSNALDVQSSWGKHELNSTLAGSSGNFGKEGALIKLGIQGGLIGLEFLVTRGHPTHRLYRSLAIINFGASAAFAGVAVHNYGVPRTR